MSVLDHLSSILRIKRSPDNIYHIFVFSCCFACPTNNINSPLFFFIREFVYYLSWFRKVIFLFFFLVGTETWFTPRAACGSTSTLHPSSIILHYLVCHHLLTLCSMPPPPSVGVFKLFSSIERTWCFCSMDTELPS